MSSSNHGNNDITLKPLHSPPQTSCNGCDQNPSNCPYKEGCGEDHNFQFYQKAKKASQKNPQS